MDRTLEKILEEVLANLDKMSKLEIVAYIFVRLRLDQPLQPRVCCPRCGCEVIAGNDWEAIMHQLGQD